MIVRRRKISEIADILTGFPFDSKLFSENRGFPLIRIRDLRNGATNTFYTGPYDDQFIVRKGDFLIGMDGEFNLVQWKQTDALLNQRVCKITVRDQEVDSKYIYYFLPKKLREIEDATPYVTVKHLSHKSVLGIEIPLPPLPTQKRIAEILEKADAARDKRRQTIELTEKCLQSAFLDIFGDPVTNPKGWDKSLLSEVSEKITDGEHLNPLLTKEGFHIITAMDVRDWGIDFSRNQFVSTDDFVKFTRKCKPENGDLLIVSRGATIGRCTRVGQTKSFCLMGSVILIKPKEVRSEFLQYLFRNGGFLQRLVAVSSASAQQAMYIKDLRNLPIVCPPLSIQQKFAALVEKVEAMRTKQRASEQELELLFQSLMQRAFNGELIS